MYSIGFRRHAIHAGLTTGAVAVVAEAGVVATTTTTTTQLTGTKHGVIRLPAFPLENDDRTTAVRAVNVFV